MSLYTIGDLHLSFGCEKPMDVFGGRWENYTEKLLEGFSTVRPEDTTVLCGDLSWGMSLAQAREDFLFIHRLPGKKIILKGNHDYWWTTAAQLRRFFDENRIDSIEILHNNCFFYEGDTAICGTRGWSFDATDPESHDRKILRRELMRLETSLKAAGEKEKLVFLHYPPKLLSGGCEEIVSLLSDYGVRACYYGHLHSGGRALAFEGESGGVRYKLVSADHLQFIPQKIL